MRISTKAVLLLTAGLAVGCGKKHSSDDNDSGNDNDATVREFVGVDVMVKQKPKGMSLLADASAFAMTLDSCASGYTQSLDETDVAEARVYKFDTGCLAKLDSFTVGATTYVPRDGAGFVTYEVGEIATFESATDANDAIRVRVTSQLNATIQETGEAVEYLFDQIDAGDDTNVSSSTVGTSATLKVAGAEAPDFDVRTVDYVGMTPAGAGQFVFGLECAEALAGETSDPTCKGMALGTIEYKLVADTYGSVLTLADADDIFSTPGVTVDVGTDVVLSGDVDLANGGFHTKLGGSADVLAGPDQMHLNPNMLLVLKSGGSYRYFNVDVETLTQP